jgi:hypothetical protein
MYDGGLKFLGAYSSAALMIVTDYAYHTCYSLIVNAC